MRILAVRFSSLGDVILTTPLLRALKRAHPAAEVTFATRAAYAPLIPRSLAHVEPLQAGESVRAYAARLPGYDHCLDLHGSLRSIALRALVRGRWSTYRKRRVARGALIHLGLGPGPLEPVAERYFTAATHLGVTPDGGGPEVNWDTAADERGKELAPSGCIVLAPGARHATKRWPAEHWRGVAARLIAMGHTVVATGTADEQSLLTARGVVNAFGIPLPVAAALMSRSRAVVANDSGLLHLATAVGTPVVGLYGPTVRAFGFHPYQSRATVLERDLPCRPCSAHGSAVCPRGHHRCLADIAPDDVVRAIAAA